MRARTGFKAAEFSGQSLRSGFLTSAAARGASIFKMMELVGTRVWTRCVAMFATPRYSATMLQKAYYRSR